MPAVVGAEVLGAGVVADKIVGVAVVAVVCVPVVIGFEVPISRILFLSMALVGFRLEKRPTKEKCLMLYVKCMTIIACGQFPPRFFSHSGFWFGARQVVPAFLSVAQKRGRCLLLVCQLIPPVISRSRPRFLNR